MARRGDYLFQRPGSTSWYIRLQYPTSMNQPRIEKSLGTSDYNEAQIKAAPMIADHASLLLAYKFSVVALKMGLTEEQIKQNLNRRYMQVPYTTVYHDDGSHSVSTDTEILYFDLAGNMIRKTENERLYLIPAFDFLERSGHAQQMRAASRLQARSERQSLDSEILENYLASRERIGKLRKDDRDSARRTLTDFRDISEGRSFASATVQDVNGLVDWLIEERGLSTGRVKKLLALLRAAVNHEFKTNKAAPRVRYNVFADIEIPDTDPDGEPQRAPFTEGEVKKIRENLHLFNDEQRLMLVWHASSSVRPGGIYAISKCEEEVVPDEIGTTRTTRYIKIRRDKGKYGNRCLPIPQRVLDLRRSDGTSILPAKIEGQLFSTPIKQLLVQINRKLDEIGVLRDVSDKRVKTFYCFRHRAKDRLLTGRAPEDLRKAIMGHARRLEAHDLYGTGYPMWEVKEYLDKIGF